MLSRYLKTSPVIIAIMTNQCIIHGYLCEKDRETKDLQNTEKFNILMTS